MVSIWNSDLTSVQRLYSRQQKLVHLQTLILYVNEKIHEHEQGKSYHYHKYLGIEEMKVYNVKSRDDHYFRKS